MQEKKLGKIYMKGGSHIIENYTLYHCHSDYSLLDSCTKFKDYVDLAVKNGQKAIASTEHGKPLGWVSKKKYCDSVGVKFMHGVEIYLTENLDEKIRDNYHTVLIAKNHNGVLELNKLVSMSCNKDHFYYKNRISFEEFLSISDDIISTSACLASPLNRLPDTHPMYMNLAKKYTFLEVQPHNHPEQISFNKRLLRLSQAIGTPLIAGTDTHSSSAYKAECRDILLLSKHMSYDDDGFDLSYKTCEELLEMFRVQNALPEEEYIKAIRNTNVLAGMVEDFELDRSIKYPILYGSREADNQKFKKTVEKKFSEKIENGVILPEQVAAFRTAIDEEMRVFEKLDMGGFMLSMSELICWCKEHGMAIGTARGSVGGSRVAYITDIIDLNPETWNTVFSRFANEDRVEVADIDVDCIESDRPCIFKYITGRFGERHTARVASFGTIASKGVIDDVGRYLRQKWLDDNTNNVDKYTAAEIAKSNPYSLGFIDEVKKDFDADQEGTKNQYPQIFYYYDGLLGTMVSQSVHPAGMVISPITLDDNYGVFDKDGDSCLMIDMEESHEVGAVKYDFLVLKTVQVIRDTCRYLGREYPKTHEINWNDNAVWEDMRKNLTSIFQFESAYSSDCFKKFKTNSIYDMSMVTACIRPSGASYRDELLARNIHKNPSKIIDDILKESNGFIIYQESVIKFLQEACGLSGSEADNVRRGIAKKNDDILQKAMPRILDGYCSKSDKPRKEAEQEAKEFLQVIEDASSYMFGYNHSIAYCLLGYLCGYYRYYHPVEFITSYLNNAANDEDIQSGTILASMYGIKVTMPKWGVSKGDYYFDTGKRLISKGLSSIKHIGMSVAEELFLLAKDKKYTYFVDVLKDISEKTRTNSRQTDILIKIDFFSEFGNQIELFRIVDLFNLFKGGDAKQIKKSVVDGTQMEAIVKRHSIGTTKSGGEAKSYTLLDVMAILREAEDVVKSYHMEDLDDMTKIRNFCDILGYAGYVSGKNEDRPKLYVTKVNVMRRHSDGVQFGYGIKAKSIGSAKETWYTVVNSKFDAEPIREGDFILCKKYSKNGKFYRMESFEHIL